MEHPEKNRNPENTNMVRGHQNGLRREEGSLKVSEDVITTIARLTAEEVEGVAGLTRTRVTFRRLFLRPEQRSFVRLRMAGDVAELSLGIIVRYGKKITDVAEAVQRQVKAEVQNMTGVTVSRIDVSVAGIQFDEDAGQTESAAARNLSK